MVQELNFQPINDRIPPQNLDAEEAILGGILLDPEAISRVLDILKPDAFYVGAHQDIYKSAIALHHQGTPADLMSVATWLNDRGLLDKVGGQSKLVQLVDRTVSAVNIDQYAQLVMDKYLRRKLISAGHQISQLGHETTRELEAILDEAEQKVFGITQVRPNQGLVATADILTKTFSEIEERSVGMALPGLASGFYDLDGKTQGFQRSDLIIAAGRPSMGKCLSHDAEIVLADGSISTIADLYQRREASLLTLGNDWKFRLTQPSHFIDDGIKPVFRVTTRLGRTVETTLTHPYLTIDGWQPLSMLKIGDRIAVPRRIDVFGTESIEVCKIKLLAYLIGDGCLTKTNPEFTNSNALIQADFTEAVTEFGALRVRRTDSNGTRTMSLCVAVDRTIAAERENPLTTWLRSLDLWGKSAHEKTIPAFVFRLARSHVALFLNRLFSTDGWATVLASGQAQLGYATVSVKLARQIQHLLLRFGIIARLKHRSVRYQGTRRPCWQLDITDARSMKTFISEIGIFSKETAVIAVAAALTQKNYQTNRDLLPMQIWQQLDMARGTESWNGLARWAGIAGYSNIHVGKRAPTPDRLLTLATALENKPLQDLATSDIYWDEIVSIKFIGEKQVYDLTIPETHNFVANDVCVHNTAFCLGLARNIASQYKLPVAVFSLEMSKEQIVQRLLASEARIESGRLRSGRIAQQDWEPLGLAISRLSELKIFIDDTPNISVTEMRSRARKLQAEQGGVLGMILVDYLQLMEGSGSENRVQELARITRALKGLARELNVPIIALSQLSRSVESRSDKRPMMSDLRESGCLTGDTLVTLADSGAQVAISELVGQSGFAVWALNEATLQLERAEVSRAFATGTKPVFRLTTRSGRTIRATANHKFLTIHGWKRLDELNPGEHLALPRQIHCSIEQTLSNEKLALLGHLIGDGCTLPHHAIQYTTREADLAKAVSSLAVQAFGEQVDPRIVREREWYQVYLSAGYRLSRNARNPIAKWLDELGVFGLRSHEKFVPAIVFQQCQSAIALFLRHLWSTDGCIKLIQGSRPRPIAFYASSSERLARDVQSLLLRFEINARLKRLPQIGKGRDQYHVTITGKSDLERFISCIGAVGQYKQQDLSVIEEYLSARVANTNRDVVPHAIWSLYALPAMKQCGLSQRQLQAGLGMSYCGTSLHRQNLSRERTARLAEVVQSDQLVQFSESQIYWDKIIAIDLDGVEEVFDLTVPGLHNFVANNIIVHNSIEQDADLVMMLYREEYYNPDTPDRGIAEVIITKHRNGPTGTIKLLFEPQYTRFLNLAAPNRQYD